MPTGLEKLKLLSAWDAEPAVGEDDLETVLDLHSMSDLNGTPPGAEEWLPTYDLTAAVAEIWIVKAARAAALTEVDPGTGIVTSKVFDNCIQMSKHYRSKRSATARLR